MVTFGYRLRKAQFEARIFVSFAIVIHVSLLSFVVLERHSSLVVSLGAAIGLSPGSSFTIGCVIAVLILSCASALRMWAGTLLQSHRAMAFRVQTDTLMTRGAYLLVRNPIYLADLTAISSFTLFLSPIGLLLPLLFSLHYLQLIKFEEASLATHCGEQFHQYEAMTPRLIPDYRSLKNFSAALRDFQINRDGIRHNSLFLLFVPGFVVAALSQEFLHAVLIGLPGVIDWAIVHTRIGVGKGKNGEILFSKNRRTRKPAAKRVFGDILYSQCWEDPQIDRIALNIQPDDVVFSITSGGCNVLTFLLDNPRRIIALDLNPYQNYLLDLKIAAFRTLTYEEMLEFLGALSSKDDPGSSQHRLEMYARLRPTLDQKSSEYWDTQSQKIAQGVIHCGQYENYMRLLRSWIYRLMGQQLIKKFLETEDPEARRDLFRNHWQNVWWWLITRVLLSRATMSLLFDKAFFTHLDQSFSFGKHFAKKAELALTKLPLNENPFTSYILLGKYDIESSLPIYLRRENYDVIRSRVDRIEWITDSCEHFFSTLPGECISKFNFTNIFEWMSQEAYEQLLRGTIRVACDRAIMTYRNLLVFRERPASLQLHIQPQRMLARSLHDRDLSFIYSNYVVEQILKEENHTCPTGLEAYAIVNQ